LKDDDDDDDDGNGYDDVIVYIVVSMYIEWDFECRLGLCYSILLTLTHSFDSIRCSTDSELVQALVDI
jgi:hypothetical protein